jgi:hypothetical protein
MNMKNGKTREREVSAEIKFIHITPRFTPM